MMQLLISPTSPYARKARVLLRETGLLERVEEVSVKTSPMRTDERVRNANPFGKIPALLRHEGPALHDSRVICRYLDALADSGLYPDRGFWEVMTLEASADALLDCAVSAVYEKAYKGSEGKSADWIEMQWSKIEHGLDALTVESRPYLKWGELNIGQIGVACALGYLDLRFADRPWRTAQREDLAQWYDTFRERPSMRETEPPAQ